MSNGETIPGQIKLTIITSTELIVDTQVKEVLIPGLEGELGILPGHRPLVLALGDGRITFQQGGVEESIQVSGGYAEIRPGSVLVFSEQPEE
jgi:F-type H+-transporting ATPase subunit epsilon